MKAAQFWLLTQVLEIKNVVLRLEELTHTAKPTEPTLRL